MSYHDRRSGRYYSPSPSPSPPPRRSLSRRDTFLDNLERGRVKDAIGAFLPGSRSKSRQRRASHHYDDRRRRGHYDDYDDDEDHYYSSDDDDYYREKRPSHRHRSSRRRDDVVDYYYEEDVDEIPQQRGRGRGRSVYSEPPRGYYHSRSRDRSHYRGGRSASRSNWRQATEAAVGAGLIEGWRSRHDGARLGRIATAAAGAAGTAMLVGREDDRKNKRHVTEATLGGLLFDRVVNGRRKK
ncbi:hypothetical protein PFICI_10982 [Pestalotiopsis fici W106-1]|uniref:Uncharacterized protein n=1 Tax=Pestalotiopsis fici (strain W106-1 / CGMCC3.15140) TaxID=1229662 RepID=W3WTB5_PESFW|nr:uncharacterized protein PFICI_10982 [Pestalotiopsis fici W106-1]ETS77108.1 hypothetical protein PFICI_10982 [Pestalotiopsis fici W106-1]